MSAYLELFMYMTAVTSTCLNPPVSQQEQATYDADKLTFRGETSMKKIAWITDTAAQLDEDFIRKHNVHILPLSVVFQDGSFRESIDFTQEEFYDKLHLAKVSPKTSQPAIGEMVSYIKSWSWKSMTLRLPYTYRADFLGHLKAHRQLRR